jgi:hypothetical protein
MFERIRARLLFWLRVPEDPSPPAGAPGSARVFRAGRTFYQLRLGRWGLAQLGAIAGIAFSLVLLDRMDTYAREARAAAIKRPSAAAPVSPPAVTPAAPSPALAPEAAPTPKAKKDRARGGSGLQALNRIAEHWPAWVFPVLRILEFGGIILFLFQIPVTYAMVRLDYELRWYIVTDRSLRIRSGLTTVQESTMSFANVQQVIVSQGPLQRLLGLADVRVQSAGGGGDPEQHKGGDSLHTGVFHGVANATEIRDLILERLRLFRAAGLGDPEDRLATTPAAPPPLPASADSLAAARELLAEARALRASLG